MRLFIAVLEVREGIAMVIWKDIVLVVVLSVLILSILGASIILATNNACFDIGLRLDGFTFRYDPQCGKPKD